MSMFELAKQLHSVFNESLGNNVEILFFDEILKARENSIATKRNEDSFNERVDKIKIGNNDAH